MGVFKGGNIKIYKGGDDSEENHEENKNHEEIEIDNTINPNEIGESSQPDDINQLGKQSETVIESNDDYYRKNANHYKNFIENPNYKILSRDEYLKKKKYFEDENNYFYQININFPIQFYYIHDLLFKYDNEYTITYDNSVFITINCVIRLIFNFDIFYNISKITEKYKTHINIADNSDSESTNGRLFVIMNMIKNLDIIDLYDESYADEELLKKNIETYFIKYKEDVCKLINKEILETENIKYYMENDFVNDVNSLYYAYLQNNYYLYLLYYTFRKYIIMNSDDEYDIFKTTNNIINDIYNEFDVIFTNIIENNNRFDNSVLDNLDSNKINDFNNFDLNEIRKDILNKSDNSEKIYIENLNNVMLKIENLKKILDDEIISKNINIYIKKNNVIKNIIIIDNDEDDIFNTINNIIDKSNKYIDNNKQILKNIDELKNEKDIRDEKIINIIVNIKKNIKNMNNILLELIKNVNEEKNKLNSKINMKNKFDDFNDQTILSILENNKIIIENKNKEKNIIKFIKYCLFYSFLKISFNIKINEILNIDIDHYNSNFIFTLIKKYDNLYKSERFTNIMSNNFKYISNFLDLKIKKGYNIESLTSFELKTNLINIIKNIIIINDNKIFNDTVNDNDQEIKEYIIKKYQLYNDDIKNRKRIYIDKIIVKFNDMYIKYLKNFRIDFDKDLILDLFKTVKNKITENEQLINYMNDADIIDIVFLINVLGLIYEYHHFFMRNINDTDIIDKNTKIINLKENKKLYDLFLNNFAMVDEFKNNNSDSEKNAMIASFIMDKYIYNILSLIDENLSKHTNNINKFLTDNYSIFKTNFEILYDKYIDINNWDTLRIERLTRLLNNASNKNISFTMKLNNYFTPIVSNILSRSKYSALYLRRGGFMHNLFVNHNTKKNKFIINSLKQVSYELTLLSISPIMLLRFSFYVLVGNKYGSMIEEGVYNYAVNSYKFVKNKVNKIASDIKNKVTNFLKNNISILLNSNKFINEKIENMNNLSDIKEVLKYYNNNYLVQILKNIFANKKNKVLNINEKRDILERIIYKIVQITCNKFVFTIPSYNFGTSLLLKQYKDLYEEFISKKNEYKKLFNNIENFDVNLESSKYQDLLNNIDIIIENIKIIDKTIKVFKNKYNNDINLINDDKNDDFLISERLKIINKVDYDNIKKYNKIIVNFENKFEINKKLYLYNTLKRKITEYIKKKETEDVIDNTANVDSNIVNTVVKTTDVNGNTIVNISDDKHKTTDDGVGDVVNDGFVVHDDKDDDIVDDGAERKTDDVVNDGFVVHDDKDDDVVDGIINTDILNRLKNKNELIINFLLNIYKIMFNSYDIIINEGVVDDNIIGIKKLIYDITKEEKLNKITNYDELFIKIYTNIYNIIINEFKNNIKEYNQEDYNDIIEYFYKYLENNINNNNMYIKNFMIIVLKKIVSIAKIENFTNNYGYSYSYRFLSFLLIFSIIGNIYIKFVIYLYEQYTNKENILYNYLNKESNMEKFVDSLINYLSIINKIISSYYDNMGKIANIENINNSKVNIIKEIKKEIIDDNYDLINIQYDCLNRIYKAISDINNPNLDTIEKKINKIKHIIEIIIASLREQDRMSFSTEKRGGYIEKKHNINNEDFMYRLMGYIFNIINDFSDENKPELRTLLTVDNLNNMLKKFISTDGFDVNIMNAKKEDGKPFKVKIDDARLLSCYVKNISILLYNRLNAKLPDKIKIIDFNDKKILKNKSIENFNKIIGIKNDSYKREDDDKDVDDNDDYENNDDKDDDKDDNKDESGEDIDDNELKQNKNYELFLNFLKNKDENYINNLYNKYINKIKNDDNNNYKKEYFKELITNIDKLIKFDENKRTINSNINKIKNNQKKIDKSKEEREKNKLNKENEELIEKNEKLTEDNKKLNGEDYEKNMRNIFNRLKKNILKKSKK